MAKYQGGEGQGTGVSDGQGVEAPGTLAFAQKNGHLIGDQKIEDDRRRSITQGGRGEQRETLRGGEGTRARNRGVEQTGGGTMPRECQGEVRYPRGRRWVVLCAKRNDAVCVRGHNTRVQGVGFLRTWYRQGVRGSGKIRLAALNIRSGRTGGLETTPRALRQGKVDVGILQETKLTDGIHARNGEGYTV